MVLRRFPLFSLPCAQIHYAATPSFKPKALLLINRPKNFLNLHLLPFPQASVRNTTFLLHSSYSSSSSMEVPPEGYRTNVGICLINLSKKIFAASRLDVPNSWQMPQGGIDEGEDPRAAAIRELREETGVHSAEVLAEVPHWITYDFPPEIREGLNKRWGSDWKGQAQKWFLFKFIGQEEEITLLGDGTEKAEFGEWAWMSPDQLTELVVDFKKPVYKEVFTFFAPFLQ